MSNNNSELSNLLLNIISENSDPEKVTWLKAQSEERNAKPSLPLTKKIFSLIAKHFRRHEVLISSEEVKESLKKSGVHNWDLQLLCRIWFLMQINREPKEDYIQTIDNLFNDAELHELAALYTALPYLAYPSQWIYRCEEGIRSNMGNVLEAIMIMNPYPAANLGDLAWNQLVLKAFFTEKDISRIIGLEKRMNKDLFLALSDYAAERRAAGRPVHEKIEELMNLYKSKE